MEWISKYSNINDLDYRKEINGFNSLSSIQKEAVIAQLMAESDKCGNTEKAILALAIKELPMENFEELGIKLEIVYKNRNGVKTVIDKNTIPAA